MAARAGTEREGRWIPAFAGMTPGKGVGILCSAAGDQCPPVSDVIPAKAGIHAFGSGRRHPDLNNADGNNP